MENADNGGIVWSDRKRIAFGLPWTFTKYTLTKEKLLIHTGMLNTQEDEVRLYRIMDVTLRRSLWERMFGLGTIHCCSADKSTRSSISPGWKERGTGKGNALRHGGG